MITQDKAKVQLAIQTVGICGTDIHFWKHGEAGGDVPDAPVVLGHESSGVVTALGEGVTHLQIGDRVAIEPNVPCHTCQDCKEGRYNLCKKLRYFAVPPYQGALCRRLNHSAHFCYNYPAALAMVASGSINVKPLITHHFKLEDSLQAFETSRTQAGGAIKVVIHCNE
ncbi:putative D-xylulose reductase A [Exaiptasia diaphana]|nr:putative D-xylulose reductase A [Exaiptasia diaphana]